MEKKSDFIELTIENLEIRLKNLIRMKGFFESTKALSSILDEIEEIKKEIKERKFYK